MTIREGQQGILELEEPEGATAPGTVSVAGLFVGCGGLDLGFRQAGYEMAWANEFNPDAAASYRALVGHDVVVADIWNVLDQVPETDVLVGGPPCQAFSLAGKRLENDPRAKLVFAYAQAVERTRPRAFVMENVPGMSASRVDGERLPLVLGRRFSALGYEVTFHRLMASDWFVPQRRGRIVMVGHRLPGKTFRLLPPGEMARILGEPGLANPVTVSQALDDLPEPLPKGSREAAPYGTEAHSAYARLMRRGCGGAVTLQTMPTMSELDREFVRHIPPGGNYADIPDEISTVRIRKFKAAGGRTTTYGRLHPDQPAYTINTYFNRPNVGANYHHRQERLITVREALRLQSFPDSFTPFYSNQRSLHMQVGNAVPPLLGRLLAESLRRLFL